MSFGKPVISTKLGNGVEWVAGHGETGITVPVNDSAALANAVVDIVEDPATYRRFSSNAAARLDAEFTAKVMATRLGDLYMSAFG